MIGSSICLALAFTRLRQGSSVPRDQGGIAAYATHPPYGGRFEMGMAKPLSSACTLEVTLASLAFLFFLLYRRRFIVPSGAVTWLFLVVDTACAFLSAGDVLIRRCSGSARGLRGDGGREFHSTYFDALLLRYHIISPGKYTLQERFSLSTYRVSFKKASSHCTIREGASSCKKWLASSSSCVFACG